jgi:hypothetical protein
MKTTSKMAVMGLALGMWGGPAGWLSAQEPASSDGAGPDTIAATDGRAVAGSNGAQPGDSHVRIVRLSDVNGTIALDRKTGQGFEQTMQNMPIVEGEKLQTSAGYAEVEFEDNSTLRLAPNSQVDFSLLALRSSGAKASTMSVVRGTVYVNLESTKDNEFVLLAGKTKMMVTPSTHLRLEVDGAKTVVSVFNGNVEVLHGAETKFVGKKASLTMDADQMTVASKVAAEPYDGWDKDSNDYHARYSKANAYAGSGNAFGLSDLNYYGTFINAGGFGQIWQPYLIGAGWSPYSNGLWALYPGAGYSWVSPYPWGWLPYHSGTWNYYPTYGWGWQPGSNWSGLNNTALGGIQTTGAQTTGAQAGNPVHSPLRPALPPQPPVAGATKATLVLSNASPIVFSGQDKSGNFLFQKNSAGLGVPRGSLGSLNKISNHVEQRGSASMPVQVTTVGRQMNVSGHQGSGGPVVLRQGMPSQSYSSASQPGAYGNNSGGQPAAYHGGGSQPRSGGVSSSGSSAGSSGGSRSSAASHK